MNLASFFLRTALPLLLMWLGHSGCAPEPQRESPASPADVTAHAAPPALATDGANRVTSLSEAGTDRLDAGPPRASAAIIVEAGYASLPESGAGPLGPSDSDASESSTPEVARVDGGGPSSDDSVSQAYAALTRGDSHAIDSSLEALERTLQVQPNDGRAALYAGTIRMWKLSEGALELSDVLSLSSLIDETLDRLGRARTLMPDDFRVPGFLGLAQVNAARLTSDDALLQKGLATLDQAIAAFPAYGHYLRAASTSGLAKDDPLFRATVDDMVALAKACVLDEIAGETAYVYPTAGTQAPSPHVCLNDGIVPHVWEGIFISFGDVALKAGWSTARVRALYRSAQTSPTYASWRFAPLLEQRIARVDSDAQLYADDNPLNDPTVWMTEGHICTGCHQAR